jgi:hypothetical protein
MKGSAKIYSYDTKSVNKRAVTHKEVPPEVKEFYRRAIVVAQGSNIPFLVGGAYAVMCYTGIVRMTKDLDLFVYPGNVHELLDRYSSAGFNVELTDPRWLAKARWEENFVDVIFASMNGVSRVDDEWFERAVPGEALDLKVKLCPVEEVIFTKAFVMDRERYDGADVAHLLLHCADNLDWSHLLRRFGDNWRVLLVHLVLFEYVYPSEAAKIPRWLVKELLSRLQSELADAPSAERICRGTLFSETQYAVDLEKWEFQDARQYVEVADSEAVSAIQPRGE